MKRRSGMRAAASTDILKFSLAIVVVQAGGMVAKVGFAQVKVSVEIVVADPHPHTQQEISSWRNQKQHAYHRNGELIPVRLATE
jgi:hypothetical protein